MRKSLFAFLTSTLLILSSTRVVFAAAQDNDVWWDGVYFDSGDSFYRSPLGNRLLDVVDNIDADNVETNENVTFRLRVYENDVTGIELRVWWASQGAEGIYPMSKVSSDGTYEWWETTVPAPQQPENVWYRFWITDGTDTDTYADDAARDAGTGTMYDGKLTGVANDFLLLYGGGALVPPAVSEATNDDDVWWDGVYFNQEDSYYLSPQGYPHTEYGVQGRVAWPDQSITIRVRVYENDITAAYLRGWVMPDNVEETYSMSKETSDGLYEWWSATLPAPNQERDYWFYFKLVDGIDEDYYADDEARDGGTGTMYSDAPFERDFLLAYRYPDFELSLSPMYGSVVPGESTVASLSVISLAGYSEQVTLSAPAPLEIAVSFDPVAGIPDFTSYLTISTSENLEPGTYMLEITGTGGDGKIHMITYQLEVLEGPGFALMINPDNGSTGFSGKVSAIVSALGVGGYAEYVELSIKELPPGITASFDPSSGIPSFDATMTLEVSADASVGAHEIVVVATGADRRVENASFLLVVENVSIVKFGLEVRPENASLSLGSKTTAMVSVTGPENAAFIVQLSAIAPNGIEIDFDPENGAPPFESVMLITIGSEVEIGFHEIRITGYALGFENSTIFSLEVSGAPPQGFYLYLTPTGASVLPGGFVEFTLSVVPIENYSLEVSLYVQPDNIFNITLNPNLGEPPFESDVTIQVPSNIDAGEYRVHIIGKGADNRVSSCLFLLTVESVEPLPGEIPPGAISIDFLPANGSLTFSVGVVRVGLKVGNENVINSWVKVEVKENVEISLPAELGKVCYYMDISTGISGPNLQTLTLTFEVERSWLNKHGFREDEIVVYCYYNERWYPLETEVAGKTENGEAVLYSVKSPVASTFAVAGLSVREEIPIHLVLVALLGGLLFGFGLLALKRRRGKRRRLFPWRIR